MTRMFTPKDQDPHQDWTNLPRPRAAQRAWQEAELGLVYHYDLHIFDNVRYQQNENRRMKLDPSIFHPSQLDTDQWIGAAKACGARFAILTASHETGFRLWQSDANPYSLKATPWGKGKRDMVGEFVQSCRRAGIEPGIYVGARWNGHLGIWDFRATEGSPLTQADYNRLIEREVEELCSRYGPLFELWFDGGLLAPGDGGPDVLPIFEKHQPKCLFYHSDQRRDARWGGTESGTVGYPCWATVDLDKIRTGVWDNRTRDLLRHGDPDGKDWCPAMADAPLRNHEWFWEAGDEHKIHSKEDLLGMYYQSVGRNATLILGAAPDHRGLIPDADMQRLKEFGDEIRTRFSRSVAVTGGKGESIELAMPRPSRIDHVSMMEQIEHGERVREYEIEGLVGAGRWKLLCKGSCIGHRRIQRFEPVEVSKLRLHIAKAVAPPIIHRFEVFSTS